MTQHPIKIDGRIIDLNPRWLAAAARDEAYFRRYEMFGAVPTSFVQAYLVAAYVAQIETGLYGDVTVTTMPGADVRLDRAALNRATALMQARFRHGRVFDDPELRMFAQIIAAYIAEMQVEPFMRTAPVPYRGTEEYREREARIDAVLRTAPVPYRETEGHRARWARIMEAVEVKPEPEPTSPSESLVWVGILCAIAVALYFGLWTR